MMRLILILAMGFVFYFVCAQALECGIAENMAQEDLQNALQKCMVKTNDESSHDKTNKNATDSSQSSEDSKHEETGTKRVRRTIFDTNYRILSQYDGVNARRRREIGSNQEDNKNQNKNGTTMTDKCTLKCIFSNLGMADENGYPNQQLVAQGLLKNAKGRELRDFIQDSTDECFQLMAQGEKLDTCEYSANLVTCLSEKAKSNCADWQITNLPFHI